MKLKATLEALYSERDRAGNCYWAFRYTDHKTGHFVSGTVSGGESNIYGLLRVTPAARRRNDWDRSVQFRCIELKKRTFAALTCDWPHAGCQPAELWKFIAAGLCESAKAGV